MKRLNDVRRRHRRQTALILGFIFCASMTTAFTIRHNIARSNQEIRQKIDNF